MGLWRWQNRAVIDLQMRAAQHDAVNNRTLNVGRGGAGLHATFGAGAASPAKLGYRRGYALDGGDYFTMLADADFPNGVYTVWMLIDIAVTGGSVLFDATAGAGVGSCALVGATITPTTGTVYQSGGSADAVLREGLRPIVIAGMTIDASTSLILGADNAGANGVLGNIHQFGVAPGTLAPIQAAQAYREMLKRYHQV